MTPSTQYCAAFLGGMWAGAALILVLLWAYDYGERINGRVP